MLCKRCKGTGKVKILDRISGNPWGEVVLLEMCYLCEGLGYTTWLSEIFEEPQTKINPFEDFTSPNWCRNYPKLRTCSFEWMKKHFYETKFFQFELKREE